MRTSTAERRQELRCPAQGEVRLRQTGSMAPPFLGRLLDQSAHGLRIRHSRLTLACGDKVEFELEGRSGAAQAVWNRIVGQEAETGFAVIG
jgi:hypothetical protein